MERNSGKLILIAIICMGFKLNLCFSSSIESALRALQIQGNFTFEGNEYAGIDFGRQVRYLPAAVLHPKEVSDIAQTIRLVWQIGPGFPVTVAARGHGHSLYGQSLASQGIVVNMESLSAYQDSIFIHEGESHFVDVSGGMLWINVLRQSLKYGLAPKSWTDYLHLTVGGTLSNAGISGQAFRHGPQISNVHQLEVVTGKGEVITCSEEQNGDLFHGVLGGLGQFGIITRARISLEPAPKMVKWIRVLYSDFATFSRDQEFLISAERTFDYIEGLVIINKTCLMSYWKSSFILQDPTKATQFISDGRTLFCLEMTKNYNSEQKDDATDKEVKSLLSQLSFIPATLSIREASYVEFLDRVHTAELKLPKGIWDLPHPWLNLIIPKSKINGFAEGIFGNIVKDTNNGPVLIYPVNKSKWDDRSSFVLPEEDIFYLVAFLPTSNGNNEGLQYILSLNKRILDFCESFELGVKQYLAHYSTQEEWQQHFGPRWDVFVQRKLAYDPLAILAPGQRIFHKDVSVL